MIDAPFIPLASSFRGLIGVAREDITPPVGIYARSWGAATHEVAEGVHRPLTLTCLTVQSAPATPPLVLISADLGWWRSRDDEWSVRSPILQSLNLAESRLMFCLSHTHAGPSLQKENAFRPGGHLIEPYQAQLRDAAIRAAQRAIEQRQPATLAWRYGTCDLATNRDLPEPNGSRVICGYNPGATADAMSLVGRVSDAGGRTIATIVNYACHPTTLAWENKLLSPDYIGAMREVVEGETNAPSLFLQGASGELAPAEQYTGDTAVADRHGRRIGYAVLSTLEGMDRPGDRLTYQGVVESGAPLAIWRQEASPASSRLAARRLIVPLPLKPLPSIAQLEAEWRECADPVLKERLWRKRGVRKVVGDGNVAEMPLWIWQVGDAFLAGQPNEAYSSFQISLRARFRNRPVAVMNLVNGSAGYLPPADLYDGDIYQVWQSPYERGGLERLTETAGRSLEKLVLEVEGAQP
jgi:hypothetical protein